MENTSKNEFERFKEGTKDELTKRKPLEMDGRTWIKYSVSIWDITKKSHEQALGHPALFPVELCQRMIKMYSYTGDTVLDPFTGSGSTLVAAKSLGRIGLGIEINEEYRKKAERRFSQTNITDTEETGEESENLDSIKTVEWAKTPKPTIHNIDARKLTTKIDNNSVDFVLTSPPYWDILNQERSADYKKKRPYSDSETDLGNLKDYDKFIEELSKVFTEVWNVLKPEKYCAVVVMDIRKQDKFFPLHMDVTTMMQKIGFTLDDIIIWDRRKEYNNLRALGYPTVFRINKVHEFILIFQKRTTNYNKSDESDKDE